MNKNLLSRVALCSLLTISMARAELKLGVMGGGNFSTYTSSVTAGVGSFSGQLGPSGLFGYQFGGFLRYEQPKWIFETDLLYTTRNAKWHGEITDGTDDIRYSLTTTLNQLELPIILYYKLPTENVADFRFGIGFFTSYGMGKIKVKQQLSNVPGSVVGSKGSYDWDEFGFKKVNFGGVFAFGGDFKIGEESKLGAELRAQTTFSGMTDKLNPQFGLGGEKVGLVSLDLNLSYAF